MQVHVVYADLSTQAVDITALDTIPHTGVQMILVKADDGRNLAMADSADHYAVCWGNQGWGEWAGVFKMDDGDFSRDYVDLHNDHEDVPVPLACLHSWFEGSRVTDAKFRQAQAVFNGLLR